MRKKEKVFFSVLIFFVSIAAFPTHAAPELVFMNKPVVDIFTAAISWLLSIAGGLGLFTLVLGGTYYILSGANPQNQATAKRIVTYAIFGLVMVLLSYAILAVVEKISANN